MDHVISQAEQPDPEVPPLAFERQYARSWLQQYRICLWCGRTPRCDVPRCAVHLHRLCNYQYRRAGSSTRPSGGTQSTTPRCAAVAAAVPARVAAYSLQPG